MRWVLPFLQELQRYLQNAASEKRIPMCNSHPDRYCTAVFVADGADYGNRGERSGRLTAERSCFLCCQDWQQVHHGCAITGHCRTARRVWLFPLIN